MKTSDDQGLLNCFSCGVAVGVKDKKEINSVQLFKWSVALQRSRELDWETCSAQEVVSAMLLALIEDQAVYKFLAFTGDLEDSKTALMVSKSLAFTPNTHVLAYIAQLWVFTPDLMYSTPAKPAQRAMKVFYNTVTDPSKLLENESNNIEELQLPNHTLKTLQADLQTSTKFLPQPARVLHEWTIGLLDRWTPML